MFPFLCSGGTSGSATITKVQTATDGNSGTGSNVVTVVLGSTPTVGNLLVASVFARSNDAAVPSGWTTAKSQYNATNNDTLFILFRIVESGDSTSWAFTFTDPGLSSDVASISEWNSSTGWPANPVDATNGAGPSTVNALNTGSATSSKADNLAVAAAGVRDLWTGTETASWDNSFVADVAFTETGGTGPATIFTATKNLSDSGALDTTATWTNSSIALAAIAIFTTN